MFNYPNNYIDAKQQLTESMSKLKDGGYIVSHSSYVIQDPLAIDKYTIKKKEDISKRIVISLGLHGIEGYVGHSALMTFIDDILPTLQEDVEVTVYHPLNPYGMYHYRRVNEHNVDLNRNFSQNNFTSHNEGYERVQIFFTPKRYRSKIQANLSYYSSIFKLIARYGFTTMKDATLKGQNILAKGLSYNGGEPQKSTEYILQELSNVLQGVEQVVWLDLHTGYGPRYQMSIVNSFHEQDDTNDLINNIDYPRILGLNKDDFYDIEGDMIEMIYVVNQQQDQPVQLYASCFEFGTVGDSILRSIASLKALLFENAAFHVNQTDKFKTYVDRLIREQFLPSSEKWREKAHRDFLQATKEVLKYRQCLK